MVARIERRNMASRARAGPFVSFPAPPAIPGGQNKLFIRTALNTVRAARGETPPHAPGEDHILQAKDTGLGRFPSRHFAINQAWCLIVALAADLKAWLRLIALDGDLATCAIKTLRHRVLTVAARLTTHGRRRHLTFATDWPWTTQIVTAFTRIRAFTPG